jgi:16S rRNA (guanine(966)-N(2))-methyltransferase RsmD
LIRIISGKYKGKRLKRVPGSVVRPMPDKLKESLFNIIQSDIRDKIFLDGFAGTGSAGLEALSRGASLAFFIDEYYPSIKVIKQNVLKCDAEDQAVIIHKEFNRAIIQLEKDEVKVDIIFLDPPYKLLEERNPVKVIKRRGILNEGGKILVRQYYKTKFDAKYYDLVRKINIGDDTILFLS